MQTTVKINRQRIEDAKQFALRGTALFLQAKMVEITPRDPLRLPKDPSRKVTGHLKQSIGNQEIGKTMIKVGVRRGYFDTMKYAPVQEFGSVHVAPRSFIRKAYYDNLFKIKQTMKSLFIQYLNRGS